MIETEPSHSEIEGHPKRSLPFAISIAVHAVAVVAIPVIGLIQPVAFQPEASRYSVTLVSVRPAIERPEPKPLILPKLPKSIVSETTAAITAPSMEKLPPAPAVQQSIAAPAIKAPEVQVARAVPAVKPSGFSTPTLEPAVARPAKQVQTGGFGDPNGLRGEGKPGARLTAAQVGSFELPAGPGVGNGTGGSTGARGVVATGGFGTPVSSQAAPTAARTAIGQSGFGDASVAAINGAVRRASAAPKRTPAEILAKPNPVYTEAARAAKIEGEVLAEVLFPASGPPRVLRTIRGLGHGLDEAAARAISQIKFKPAQQDGQPVDSVAIIHVVFKLA